MSEAVARQNASQSSTQPEAIDPVLAVMETPESLRQAYDWVNRELKRQNSRLIAKDAELSEKTTKLEAMLANMSQGVLMLDPDHRVAAFNRRFEALIGYPAGAVRIGSDTEDLISAASELGHFGTDTGPALEQWNRRLAQPRPSTHEQRLASGRTLCVTYVPLDGGGWLITYEDVSERIQSQEAIAASNARLDAALSNMMHGLCMYDPSRRLILCNAAYAAMYKLPPRITQPGTPIDEILAYRIETGTAPVDLDGYRSAARVTSNDPFSRSRISLVDGRTVQIVHRLLPDGGFVATHEDISEAVRADATIRYLATHDALTDLPNRVQLRTELDGLLDTAIAPAAVLCLDLDHFKAVNDTLGHPIGDALLKEVADRLRTLRGEDLFLSRLGGDEFVVVVPDADPDAVGLLAQEIIATVGQPYDLGDHRVVVGVSIGMAMAPQDGSNADILLKNADLALYRAKSDGRGVYRCFEPQMDARAQARRRMELDLRNAVACGEFELHYQPVVDAASEALLGFEALIRWRHPTDGLVFPAEFIPLAEQIGLIVPIGEWVIRQACADAAAWPPGIRVAINLSPAQLKSATLLHTVVSALGHSGLSPWRLELEITETVLLSDMDTTLAVLHEMKRLGVRIAMDDFGTGYSSLSYLRAFPFDKIKIDRSFINDLVGGRDSAAIVKAITVLSENLGIPTTAEGVETIEQLDAVRSHGCTEVQGYFYSRPLHGEALTAWLALQSGQGQFLKAV